MGQNNDTKERCLVQARALIDHLESDNDIEANRVLEELASYRDTDLFQEIGKLTRNLHEALNGFHLDSRVTDLAEKEIPDAKERLNYVVTMTEQAANRTMDAVEQSLPLAEGISKHSDEFKQAWQRFRGREMSVEEFRDLSLQLDGFFNKTGGDIETIRGNLSDVLMAQDFQDLTGQIIRRVINLVQEVEESLVNLVRITGKRMAPEGERPEQQKDEQQAQEDSNRGVGPAVPGVDKGDVMDSQDDVDDLLSSLGF